MSDLHKLLEEMKRKSVDRHSLDAASKRECPAQASKDSNSVARDGTSESMPRLRTTEFESLIGLLQAAARKLNEFEKKESEQDARIAQFLQMGRQQEQDFRAILDDVYKNMEASNQEMRHAEDKFLAAEERAKSAEARLKEAEERADYAEQCLTRVKDTIINEFSILESTQAA